MNPKGGPVSLTSLLDLCGVLLLILAVAVLVAPFTLPGALALAGGLLLAFSWLLDRGKR